MNHQKIVFLLFIVPHLELIQGRSAEERQLWGLDNMTHY